MKQQLWYLAGDPQLPKMLGFSVSANDVVSGIVETGRGIIEGEVVAVSALVGGLCLLVILVLRRLVPRFPGVLVAVLPERRLAMLTVRARPQPA